MKRLIFKKHFLPEDWTKDKKGKTVLKPDAVPQPVQVSRLVKDEKQNHSVERNSRAQRRLNNKLATSTLSSHSKQTSPEDAKNSVQFANPGEGECFEVEYPQEGGAPADCTGSENLETPQLQIEINVKTGLKEKLYNLKHILL